MVPSSSGRALEQPQRGRADRHDAPAGRPRRVERVGGLGADRAPLGVHVVLVAVVAPSSAGTSRRRHAASPCDASTPIASRRCEQRLGEMQPGRRRRDGAVFAGIDRLVVAPVEAVGRRAGWRCRAAAAPGRWRRSPRRAPVRRDRSVRITSPASPLSSTVASSPASRQALSRFRRRSASGRRPPAAWPAGRAPPSARP